MSRFSQYNKNDTYRDNFKYANLQKERRTNEELQEIERDRIAMERLQIELDQEKKLEKERKNQIKQMQYEDYSNYMRQKYSETPQNREKLNIKVGGEQRHIRKPNYNQQMENLCLNPTKQENIYPTMPIQNFSEAGRNYQRGYSHGYNILTGESYSQNNQAGKQTPKVTNNNNINFAGYNEQQDRVAKTEYPKGNNIQNKDISNKEKEDFSQYQAYMEMKRQKEQEEMYYLQMQNEKEKLKDNKNIEQPQNYNEIKEKENYDMMKIPPEYRDIYMRQQVDPQQNQEIPPEYKEMYLRKQMEQEQQELERQQKQEIPPEYKEMYLRKQMEQEQQELERQKKQEIPPEYKEMYMKQQSQQQLLNNQDEKNKIIPQQNEEIPNEYNEIMQQQTTQKHGRSTPYNVKMNNFINQRQQYHNENNKPKIEKKEKSQENNNNLINKENKIHQEQISEEDYKSYLLAQQKEKEDENMEIYQNMLKEKEKEKEVAQLENNQEREQYLQYLLNQQNQNKTQNVNQIMDNKQYQNQYQERPEMQENQISSQKINSHEINEKPINSFEDYYKEKGINVTEQQPQIGNQNINENQYENYPPYSKEMPLQNLPQSQEQGFDEQAYLMYQQQKQMQEIQEMEERERMKQILERQQMEKMNINNMNDINIQNDNYPQGPSYNPLYNNQIQVPERKSEFNTAKMEYLQNKQKNMLSKDNIFSVSEVPKPPPKYNNEPLTNADRLRIQREYAQFLDSQINAKMIKNSKNRNNGLGTVQNTGYDVGGINPYQQLREKHNKLKDIPQDPYSVKNYNISSNSYLTSNPITNPVNSYKFVDRRKISSGRLQNNGSNIIGK